MDIPFERIEAKLDALADSLRALNRRTNEKPADEIGGVDLAMQVTGLARRSIYKATHFRTIPHRRVGGRLYFRRSELEQWIDAGRRKTVTEKATDVMKGNK